MIYPPIIDNSRPYIFLETEKITIPFYFQEWEENGKIKKPNTSIVLVKITDENNRSVYQKSWDSTLNEDQYISDQNIKQYARYYSTVIDKDQNYYKIDIDLKKVSWLNGIRTSVPNPLYIQLIAFDSEIKPSEIPTGQQTDNWLKNSENKNKYSRPSDMVVWRVMNKEPSLSIKMDGCHAQDQKLSVENRNYMSDASRYYIEATVTDLDENDEIVYGNIKLLMNDREIKIPNTNFLLPNAKNGTSQVFIYEFDKPMGFSLFISNLILQVSFQTKFGYYIQKVYHLRYNRYGITEDALILTTISSSDVNVLNDNIM